MTLYGDPAQDEPDVCRICGEATEGGDHDWIGALDGTQAHVHCLEDAGEWNATPEELR